MVVGAEMMAWHALSGEEVLARLEVDAQTGLTPEEAARRLARYGPNRLSPRRGRGPLLTFLFQFHQPLIYILIVAAIITGCLGEWTDAGVIFGVVLANAVIGFIQEYRAARAIHALARTMTAEAVVLRGGVKRRVLASKLVPGDIVLLSSGNDRAYLPLAASPCLL